MYSRFNKNGNLDYVVNGLHSVVKSDEENGVPKGTIFILKNINSNEIQENNNADSYVESIN